MDVGVVDATYRDGAIRSRSTTPFISPAMSPTNSASRTRGKVVYRHLTAVDIRRSSR